MLVSERDACHVEVDVEDSLLELVLMGLAVFSGSDEADLLSTAPQELHGPSRPVLIEVMHELHDCDGTGGIVPASL